MSGSNISTNVSNGKLTFEIMNKQDNVYGDEAENGPKWINITLGQTGAIYVGGDSTFTNTTANINVVFGNGAARDIVYLRITMQPECTATINSIICS